MGTNTDLPSGKDFTKLEISTLLIVLFWTIVIVVICALPDERHQPVELPQHTNLAEEPVFDKRWDGFFAIDGDVGNSIYIQADDDGVYRGNINGMSISFTIMESDHDYAHAMYCVETVCHADLISLKDGIIRGVSWELILEHIIG